MFPVKVFIPELEAMPVIAPPLEILLTRFPDTVDEPLKLTAKPVTADVPPVQLVKVLPVTVLIGEPPSVLAHPAIVVAPVTVIFEKLLLVLISLIVAPDTELEVYRVIVPPAPVLLKAVTIELLLILPVPLVGRAQLLEINVNEPVVVAVMLVNVLPEIL